MNQREKKEIGLNIATLMTSVLDENAVASEISNAAISFCGTMLRDFPDVHEVVDDILDNGEWDDMISWIRYKKNNNLE